MSVAARARHLVQAVILPLAIMVAGPLSAQIESLQPTSSQLTPRIGIGYVVNAPTMFVGLSALAISSKMGGIGLYVDAKLDIQSPVDEPGYIADLTRNDVEDGIAGQQFFREEDAWRSINAAIVRPLGPQLMVYAGAGYAERERFWEYIDSEREMGLNGLYWVRYPEESGGVVNLLGGAMFGIGTNFWLQFGLETAPAGATVGVAYTFDLK